MSQNPSKIKDNPEKKDIEKKLSYPVLFLEQKMILPFMKESLHVIDSQALAQIENKKDFLCIIANLKDKSKKNPGLDDIYPIGTLVKVLSVYSSPDKEGYPKNHRLLVTGLECVKIVNLIEKNKGITASIEKNSEEFKDRARLSAINQLLIEVFEREYPKSKWKTIQEEDVNLSKMDPKSCALFISSIIVSELNLEVSVLQKIFSQKNLENRLTLIKEILAEKISEKSVYKDFQNAFRQTEQDYKNKFLQVIKKETLDRMTQEDPLKDLKIKYEEIKDDIDEEARRQIEQNFSHLEGMSTNSSEYYTQKSFIENTLDLPWKTYPVPEKSFDEIAKFLEENHYGLDKVKKLILEWYASSKRLKKKSGKTAGTVLILHGAPGVGKTSIIKVIAQALGLPYIHIAVGGMHDEAEFRGHRRTYIGARPGIILSKLSKAKTRNVVFGIDEVDKIGRESRGDAQAALLEILDPEQNTHFRDHYYEFPFSLEPIMFICTANNIQNIPSALFDRMTPIFIASYTQDEKFNIAKEYIIPKILKKYDLNQSQISFSDAALKRIITSYTCEAGVRDLKRWISKIISKTILLLDSPSSEKTTIKITEDNIEEFLETPFIYSKEKSNSRPTIGVSTGLVWTEYGGEILFIESILMPLGEGKIVATGLLGEVMKESITVAHNFIRSHMKHFGIDPEKLKDYDIHIHFPAGSRPKDGPSAGVAIALSILSCLLEKPLKNDVGVTGEINLRGNIMPIGGLKEKILAAYRSGLKKVLIPFKNERNLIDLPLEVKNNVEIVLVKDFTEALSHFFADPIGSKEAVTELKNTPDSAKKETEESGKKKETNEKKKKHKYQQK